MNIRIRDWKDEVFFITTFIVTPIIAFFVDVYKGKKRIKDLTIPLIIDLIIFVGYVVFIILAYGLKII